MKKLALLLLAGSALVSPAIAQTGGAPFGTQCPASLPLGTSFANTAAAPTGTTLNIWDGAQCVPWATLNQTAHSISVATGGGAALTRTNDTNVTVTLGGSPATALFAAASLTLGWTGTLAAGRLNANVVQGITNDTNVTGTITAQNLTLGWTGSLAVARGGTGGTSASGTLLDNITGFSGTGFLTRTGAGTYAFQSATNGVTLGNLVQSGANTMLGNWTGGTANVAANAMPSCADTGGNHLNYVSGTGITCGTSGGGGGGITALTGDVTASGSGSVAATLATVNTNVGSFGSATATPNFTVNAKGLITAASTTVITPAASSITGGAALTESNDTNVTLTLGGTPATSLLAATSLTLGWTGILASARGGTANGFFTVAGPTTSAKTFTFPNANATIARTDTGQTFAGADIFSGTTTLTNAGETATTSPFTINSYGAGNNAVAANSILSTDGGALSTTERHTLWLGNESAGTGDGSVAGATYGLVISAIKTSYLTTTTPGQTGSLVLIARGGVTGAGASCPAASATVGCGDTSALQWNVLQSNIDSSAIGAEGNTLYSTDGSVTCSGCIQIHNQVGVIRQDQPIAFGYVAQALNGTAATAFYAANTSTGVTNPGLWTNFLQFLLDDGTHTPYTAFSVDSVGELNIAGPGAAGTNQKTWRVGGSVTNSLEFLNSARNAVIANLTDAGVFTANGYTTAGAAGVDCATVVAATVVVSKGIVTHC